MSISTIGRAETRVALVLGNGAYQSLPALQNPPNDARDVAAALHALGFAVSLGLDLDQAHTQRAIADFTKDSSMADVSLFYYGGHGLQVLGHNYLLPIDAQLKTVDDIDQRTVHFDDVIKAQEGRGVHLIFLDACRNSPLKEGSAIPKSAGLARVGEAAGFLIAFATQPDRVAFDGAGRNSPFAGALLGHIASAGIDISTMLIEVRKDVIAATGGAQVPWENSSLTTQFFFAAGAKFETAPETQLFRLAANLRDPHLLEIYVERYPQGPHVEEVRALAAEIEVGPAPQLETKTPLEREDTIDVLWNLAREARRTDLLELYIARYPEGVHNAEARRLLAALRAAQVGRDGAATRCERLTTHPRDATANLQGVELADLAANAAQALAACREASTQHPELPHFVALLARATVADGRPGEAAQLFRKAADAGDARAMVSLGLMLESGDHAPKDVKAALTYYEAAAAKGFPDGAINLAVALMEGRLGERNPKRAYSLLRAASRQGSAIATYDLAELTAAGVEGKSEEAFELYIRAAEQGEPRGYWAAAALLDHGSGGGPDAERASDLLLRGVSADFGEAESQMTGRQGPWSSRTVSAVQTRLKSAGYYSAAIDGKTGPGLTPALKKWRLLGPPSKS